MARYYHTSRSVLLALSLLSGCAASGAGSAVDTSGPYGAYLVGRFAQDGNELHLAAANLLRALAHDPHNVALLNQTFVACLLDERPEAIGLARQLPASPIAQLFVGNVAARQGDWQAAQAHYAALSAPGMMQILSPLLVAWAQQGRADTDAALAALEPKLNGQPLTGLYALHAALIADLGNRFPQAQRLYGVATSNYGGPNLSMARVLANWQFRQGHLDDAEETLRALVRGSPALAMALPALLHDMRTRPIRSATDGLAEVYLAFAAEIRRQNGADTALTLLRLALDLRPDLTTARLLMADTLAGDMHTDSALRVLAAVGAADPLSPLVRLRRAQLEANSGAQAAAAADLRRLADDYPQRPEPLAALGELERGQKRLTDAIATYDAAIARAPFDEAASWALFFARAVAKQSNGNWPGAEIDLRHALMLAPDQPEVLNYLGYAWADRNQHLSEARTMLTRATNLQPNNGAFIDSLGWVMLRQGDVADAVTSLERAAQMQPEDAEINGHLGDAYWAAGRKLQARYQWQLALNLKPEPDAVPRLRAKLQNAERATERATERGRP